ITVVINSKPGPTSKAQCLNEILNVMTKGIEKAQKDGEKPWIPRFVAIHDAEDVIHPLSFTAINAQSEDVDFIKVPIFSLPVATRKHTSELQSRENLVCRLLLEKKKKKK